MAELFDMKELEERVILVAVSTSDEDDTEASLDELEELADTAGGDGDRASGAELRRFIQAPIWAVEDRGTAGDGLGNGRKTGVICDDRTVPGTQLRNLESALDTKVMDWTMKSFSIFSRRMRRRARENPG